MDVTGSVEETMGNGPALFCRAAAKPSKNRNRRRNKMNDQQRSLHSGEFAEELRLLLSVPLPIVHSFQLPTWRDSRLGMV